MLRKHIFPHFIGNSDHSWHDVARSEVVVPRPVANVFLGHHASPFSTSDFVVISCAEQRVSVETFCHAVGPAVGIGISLLRQLEVHRLCIVHRIDIAHCLDGEENDLLIHIALLRAQAHILAQGLSLQAYIVAFHFSPLTRLQVVGLGIEHLGGHAAVHLAAEVQQTRCLLSFLFAKHRLAERFRMTAHHVGGHRLRVPRHIHEQLDGVFHRLQVTHIQNPHAPNTVVIGQRQLFPHVLRGRNVQPFAVARRTDVVHMVIQTPATFMLPFLTLWHPSDISPIIVAEQHDDIIRHTHSLVVVVEYLFIQRPHLRSLARRPTRDVGDDAPLVRHNPLQQLCIGILAHRFIAVAAHTDGHQVFRTSHALDTLTEETVEHRLIGLVVPGSILPAMSRPFLMVACHRFMMARTDNNAHFIGQTAIFWVIGIESPTPHSRPQQIAPQAQQELEHFLVERMAAITGMESVEDP